MGLFSIFKKQEPVQKINSVYELFDLDFEKIPDGSFSKTKEINDSGDEILIFKKSLSSPAYDIFDSLLVRADTDKKVFNYSLSKNFINSSDIGTIKKLVNTIYALYGSDDSGQGLFNNTDLNDLKSEDFWSGRTWSDRFPLETMINYDEEDGVSIIIWPKLKEEPKKEIKQTFEIAVVGCFYDSHITGKSRQPIVRNLKQGDKMVLKPEPENQYDKNAVLVLDTKENDIGHVPGKETPRIHKFINENQEMDVFVKKIFEGNKGYMCYLTVNVLI